MRLLKPELNILELQAMREWIEKTQLPLEQQEHQLECGKMYTCDMWHLLVLDALISGEAYLEGPYADYVTYRTPQYLKQVLDYAMDKANSHRVVAKNSHLADCLVICEMGRGIDILLNKSVKKWKRVICYDANEHYGRIIIDYFKKTYGLNVEFFHANTGEIDWSIFPDEPSIVVHENTRLGINGFKQLLANPNVKLVVMHGIVLDSAESFERGRVIGHWELINELVG